MMDVRPIRNEADHRWALEEIERYFDDQPALNTPEGDRFDVLATLISAYEDEHFPMPEADPVDMLHFAIEDMGRSQADLARILDSRSRASEVLNRKRPLTLDMIRAISEAWKLPTSLLVGPYRVSPAPRVFAKRPIRAIVRTRQRREAQG